MRRVLTLLSMTLAAPAFAGGVAEPDQPPVMIQPPAETDWTGFYAGAIVTYGQGTPTGTSQIDGIHSGLVVGYRLDMGDLVVGLELEMTNGDISGAPQRDLRHMFTSGLEIGYDAGALLPYATFGVAYAVFDEPVILPNYDAAGHSIFFGIGVDYALNDEVTLGAEIVQHRFTDFPLPNTDLSLNTLSLSATFRF